MNGFKQQKTAALIACHVIWRELAAVLPHSNLKITPIFFEQGLHDQPSKLQNMLQQQIDLIDDQYDYILLGYGLCSNGISGLKTKRATLVVPRAHDCITLILGSKEKYRQLFDAYPGTYWFNHGWMETGSLPGDELLAAKRKIFLEKYEDLEIVDFLIEQELHWIADYKNICLIEQPSLDLPPHQVADLLDYSQKSADTFQWTLIKEIGDLSLFTGLVSSPWNLNQYLVIEPGQQIEPSYDEQIIKAI